MMSIRGLLITFGIWVVLLKGIFYLSGLMTDENLVRQIETLKEENGSLKERLETSYLFNKEQAAAFLMRLHTPQELEYKIELAIKEWNKDMIPNLCVKREQFDICIFNTRRSGMFIVSKDVVQICDTIAERNSMQTVNTIPLEYLPPRVIDDWGRRYNGQVTSNPRRDKA